jgi:hypothetical protein
MSEHRVKLTNGAWEEQTSAVEEIIRRNRNVSYISSH